MKQFAETKIRMSFLEARESLPARIQCVDHIQHLAFVSPYSVALLFYWHLHSKSHTDSFFLYSSNDGIDKVMCNVMK